MTWHFRGVTMVRRNGMHVAVALGPGPERATVREALHLISQDSAFWTPYEHSEYVVPCLSPGSSAIHDRVARYKAHAFLLALHCLYYGQGTVVSFWVVLALVMGPSSMLQTPESMNLMDPVAATKLKPWFDLSPTDPLPTDLRHPVNQLIIDVLDIQVRVLSFCNPHTHHLLLVAQHVIKSSNPPRP